MQQCVVDRLRRREQQVVEDRIGDTVMADLRKRVPGTGEFTGAPWPKLILLDLKLGETHGLEVLAELKRDYDLLAIPVVILSSSRHPTDIDRSYALHATATSSNPLISTTSPPRSRR
jgi:CheY-like chemotaxis protein